MNHKVVVGLLEIQREHFYLMSGYDCRDRQWGTAKLTMATELEIEHVTDADVYYSKEALIALLELALVEDLHRNDGGLLDGT